MPQKKERTAIGLDEGVGVGEKLVWTCVCGAQPDGSTARGVAMQASVRTRAVGDSLVMDWMHSGL